MFEREYRDLSYVPRWGIIPTTRTQNVAEHSYFVTLYTLHICKYMNYDKQMTADCLLYAVEHDREECFMSDIPGPVKRNIKDEERYENFKSKGSLERFGYREPVHPLAIKVVKVADLMDEVAFWHEQQFMGNSHSEVLIPECEDRLLAACQNLSSARGTDLYTKFLGATQKNKIIPRNDDDLAN